MTSECNQRHKEGVKALLQTEQPYEDGGTAYIEGILLLSITSIHIHILHTCINHVLY